MRYAILIYDDPKVLEAMDPASAGEMYAGYEKFATRLDESGRMRGGEQLSAVSTTTLRNQQGEVVVHDGPFAETKEQLGGFFLIECDSLDEALDAAREIPSLRWGGVVEVRPVVEGPSMEHH
jgi:hypothetical protein